MRDLPANVHRIILINPTRYLGNLLISGGLIQDFAAHCERSGIVFRLVIDEAFAELFSYALNSELLIVYPRRKIAGASGKNKLLAYLHTLKQIRQFRADIAFNIEEDSVSHRLTQLSGARYRLGCSTQHHGVGYSHVLPVNYTTRPTDQQHRWFSFSEVFSALGLPPTSPGYLRLAPPALSRAVLARLQGCGLDLSRKLAVLHTGATKPYKKWPAAHFAELIEYLHAGRFQVVLIGAGSDGKDIHAVLALLPENVANEIVNLYDQMSLAELAAFLPHAALYAGNDSGPFHLAAALGVKGVAIFGPTRLDLWGPLTGNMQVLKDASVCSVQCTRKQCLYAHRCLVAITPVQVMNVLEAHIQ